MTSKPVGVLSYQCDILATLSYAETTWKELLHHFAVLPFFPWGSKSTLHSALWHVLITLLNAQLQNTITRL